MASALSEKSSPSHDSPTGDQQDKVLKVLLKISPRITDWTRNVYQIREVGETDIDYGSDKIYEKYVWKGTLASTLGLLSIFERTLSLKFQSIRGELFYNSHSKFLTVNKGKNVFLLCERISAFNTIDVPTKQFLKKKSGKNFFSRLFSKVIKEFEVYQRHYLPIYHIKLIVPETFEKDFLSHLYDHLLKDFNNET